MGHTTRPKPRCPNPLDRPKKMEPGRIAGYGAYPYKKGEEVRDSWQKYEGEPYISSNLVPARMWPRVKVLAQGVVNRSAEEELDLIKRQFVQKRSDIFLKGSRAIDCSTESYNICALVHLMASTGDKAKVKAYRHNLKRQYRALKRRGGMIYDKMEVQLNAAEFERRRVACTKWHEKSRLRRNPAKPLIDQIHDGMSQLLESHNLADERILRVCAHKLCSNIFDPRHVPTFQRCVHPGCCTDRKPSCQNHTGFCDLCHDPVCMSHLWSGAHKTMCQRTLSSRCGWRGSSNDRETNSLDPLCCGTSLDNSADVGSGQKCAECAVLCCSSCFSPCPGWSNGTKDAKKTCTKAKGWCKKCVKETYNSTCDACLEQEENGGEDEDDSDDSDYVEDESSDCEKEADDSDVSDDSSIENNV